MTPEVTALAADIRTTCDRINAAVHGLVEHAKAEAEAERTYRKAAAVMWIEVSTTRDRTTAAEREAAVKAATADERYARDVARGMWTASREAVRARQQELSALQSLLKVEQAEVDMARFGPEVTP